MERVAVDELNLSTEMDFARNWEFGHFLEAINSYEFCWLLIRVEIFGVLA
jgi:hypothetical protein